MHTLDRKTVILGTRGSTLALAQAELVRSALMSHYPDADVRLEVITTRGDAVQDRPLSQIGGNGVFVRQIETALQEGSIDMAVHSAKDLPSALAPGMIVAAYLPRADARDVLISRDGVRLSDLPHGARVGTSSPRRACQLRALRPDLHLLDLRGNVDTRLRKLRDGQYEAIVLAAAGLERLGIAGQITEWLDPSIMLPAVGQGAIAVEARMSDGDAVRLVESINDDATWAAVSAERAFLGGVGGSCSLPVAAYATLSGDSLTLTGMIGSVDGRAVKGARTVKAPEGEAAGAELAAALLSSGGKALVREYDANEAR